MNTSILRRYPIRLVTWLGGVACLVLALGAAGSPSAAGSPITSLPGGLLGVSALSASSAWAVGSTGAATLILHWNGTAWAKVTAPSPGHLGRLTAVSALSPSNAWAVGSYETSSGGNKTLILHWNGTSWVQVASPSPEVIDGSFLLGVSAVSSSDAWAAGWYYLTGGESSNTLILHWNGTSWTRVPSPNPVHLGFNALNGVSGRSAADAWAVGSTDTGTLILHWNGTGWTRVASPGRISQDALNGVSALSASDAWSAGNLTTGALVSHWNGTAWTQVPSNGPGTSAGVLNSVSARTHSDAWAAGYFSTGSGGTKNLVLHWNGTNWTEVTSPSPGGAAGSALSGVDAVSASSVWAVGSTSPFGTGGKTLILHWNGSGWTRS
jgi:hypothetical protein